jgi:site-specific DNA recombinase
MTKANDRFNWVKDEFNRIATDHVLGDPAGRPGMAYLRVSSAGQADEGRSGFPRQLVHVHEKAYALRLAIPWDLVFFDDHTGFEFRDRPALTRLRALVKSPDRPASDLVIENLDRLSREATWHQGFLLEEFEKDCRVNVHFWKELPSTLERVVYGTIAQDRMLTDLERMANGNLLKAKTSRVTARTPAYGYRFVNSTGGQEDVKKDTHYAIYEPEARIVRLIFTWLVKDRDSIGKIAQRLVQMGVQPPKRSKAWDPSLLRTLLMNPVYKGEFYAHRKVELKVTDPRTGKSTKRRIERPREEWILVPVPALVSANQWDCAQKIRKANRERSLRNTRHEYLLTGLAYCAHCKDIKMSITAKWRRKTTRHGLRVSDISAYRCNTRSRLRHVAIAHNRQCSMPQINCRILDEIIWRTIVQVLFDTCTLKESLARYFARQSVTTIKEEIAFIQSQLTALDVEDESLYRAYLSQAFDADEFAARRQPLRDRRQKLHEEKEALQRQMSQQASREEMMQGILETVEALRAQAQGDIPFELKRKIVRMVVEKVTLDTREERFEIEGAIVGSFDFIPAGRDSWRPASGSWPGK